MNMLLVSFSDVAETILYILLALVVLLIMITIHETGHYTAGKILGFKINEFAIGMGPKLFSKTKKNGEIFSVRLLPLGGFCAFEGEDENVPDSPGAFNNQKPWKRIIVLISGAMFNFLSAIIIVFIAFWAFGDNALAIEKVYDTSVNYEAYQNGQGFKEGDIIYKIDGKVIYLVSDVSNYIANAGEKMEVVVLRTNSEGKREKVTLENVKKGKFFVDKTDADGNIVYDDDGNPVKIESKGWGVQNKYVENKFTFGQSLGRSIPYCLRAGGFILETLGGLITGRVPLKDIGGPITTIDMTSQVIKTGFSNVLFLITLVSVNLAVFNLLPLPALDGSRVVFVLIEWIFKKPVNRKIEGWIHAVGMILLFGLVILVDILRYLT